ncbi:MAG: hypothetical protein ACM3U2_23770 [Deltaproteobacteria bacterium]
MTTFYVATRARYVLVEAADEAEARRLGKAALQQLHAEVAQHIGRDLPVEIHVVRPATEDEIELQNWHREMTGDA